MLEIIVLGIVQGITEFLPVSSSGHLVIAQSIFEHEPSNIVAVNIFLHAGTLAAILVYFWPRIVRLLSEDRRVIGLLAVGTIPAVAFGLPLKKYGSGLLNDPLLTGFLLIATGLLLIWSGRRQQQELDYHRLTYAQALIIGAFQAIAVLPGLSRSGWTIGGGLLLGMKRDAAATFSFLLAIPVIAGATILEIADYGKSAQTTSVMLLAVGVAVSFFVGLASLWLLVHTVRRGKLHWFAAWCIPVGLAVIVWQLAG